MWRRWLERRAEAAWYGGAWWSILLLPLSWLVAWGVRRRRQAFLTQSQGSSPLPVVVIGGITVGGTGKSPVLIALACALQEHGTRVAVVSRGYGGVDLDQPRQVDPVHDSASLVGDEPLLIARSLEAPVVVCRHRALAVGWLAERGLADVVLADDGLQHYGMARCFEVAVLDGERGVGNGRLLPAGPLREPVSRLDSVDWILERNGGEPDTAFRYRIQGLRPLHAQGHQPVDRMRQQWRGQRLLAVTGLGQPDQYFAMLRRQGFDIRALALADHAVLAESDLSGFEEDIILITAKDEVKLAGVSDERVWVVDVVAELPRGLLPAVVRRLENEEKTTCSAS